MRGGNTEITNWFSNVLSVRHIYSVQSLVRKTLISFFIKFSAKRESNWYHVFVSNRRPPTLSIAKNELKEWRVMTSAFILPVVYNFIRNCLCLYLILYNIYLKIKTDTVYRTFMFNKIPQTIHSLNASRIMFLLELHG